MTTLANSPSLHKNGLTDQTQYAGFWAGAWRRFRRNKLAMFGVFYVTLLIIVL